MYDKNLEDKPDYYVMVILGVQFSCLVNLLSLFVVITSHFKLKAIKVK